MRNKSKHIKMQKSKKRHQIKIVVFIWISRMYMNISEYIELCFFLKYHWMFLFPKRVFQAPLYEQRRKHPNNGEINWDYIGNSGTTARQAGSRVDIWTIFPNRAVVRISLYNVCISTQHRYSQWSLALPLAWFCRPGVLLA